MNYEQTPMSEPISTDPLLEIMRADLAADHSSAPMKLDAIEIWLNDHPQQVMLLENPSVNGEILTGYFTDDPQVPVHIRGSAILAWRWTSMPEYEDDW